MKPIVRALAFLLLPALAFAQEAAAPASGDPLRWVLGANLVIWGGIGLYALRLGFRLKRLEKGD